MKTLMLALMVFTSVPTFAQDLKTQDNIDYIIITELADINVCADQICQISEVHGNGSCRILSRAAGILVANLTGLGASQVAELACVTSIEEDQPAHINPRVGRSN